MPNESLHVEPHHERLDADAVCERCGTVSPEDTLLCKTCGNNLRDQRTRRIAVGGDPQAASPKKLRWSWLASALTAIGLIVLVWTGLNVESISQNLFMGDESAEVAEQFWTGPDSATYRDLKAELTANPVSDTDAQKAHSAPVAIVEFSGRYVILSDPGAGTPQTLGTGIVRQEGENVYFVAILDRGAEIRGQAQLVGESTPAARDTAAIFVGGEYYLASGVALKRDTELGGYICHAQTSESNPVSVLLFKIP